VIADAKMVALIAKLAEEGRRERGIYIALGISAPTFIRLKREDPRVAEALECGNEAFHDALVADLRRMAKRNHIVAPIFLLKSRFNYSDQGHVERVGAAEFAAEIRYQQHALLNTTSNSGEPGFATATAPGDAKK
jgi:hypothetical protein